MGMVQTVRNRRTKLGDKGAQIKRFNYDVQFQSWCWEADFSVGWRLQFFLLHALLWLPCVVLSCWRILGTN